jgi:pilus assembly protein CpaB
MRAVSTEISPETGAGGFILPNDRVDVILSRRERTPGGVEVVTSEVILGNIRVLAIDQAPRERDGQNTVVGKTATLELKPSQAEALARARQTGILSLALRSLVDANTDAPRTEERDGVVVTVFRGDEREVLSCTPLCRKGGGGG